jgi:cytidylate kinase
LKTVLDQTDILKRLVVAIDGPAGSGKSTTARLVSAALGLRHIDTGAMYRAVAYLALDMGVDPEDESGCGAIAETIRLRFESAPDGGQTVFAGDEDVTAAIRTPEVTRAVSPVSAHAQVRRALVLQQRRLAGSGGAVLEGRDIGTVVLTGADVKIYLVASARVRAERRKKELDQAGAGLTLDQVEKDILRRDEYDSSRAVSPLRKAVGAVEVDTSAITIDEQVARIAAIARETAGRLAQLRPVARRNAYRKFRPHYRFGVYLLLFVLKLVFGLRVHRNLNVDYDENYIFACNHLSNADPPTVGSTFQREVYFLAKSALFTNPLFGRLIRAYNALPIRRGVFDRDAMARALELLGEGRSLLIFPEGSRASGEALGRPKSGVGYLAIKSGVAVLPVYVSGTNRLFRCFLRRERLVIRHGDPIRLAPGSVEDDNDRDLYRAFSEQVMEAIQGLKDEIPRSR